LGLGIGAAVRPVLVTRHSRAINILFFRKLISFFMIRFLLYYDVIIVYYSRKGHAKIGKWGFSSFGMFKSDKICYKKIRE